MNNGKINARTAGIIFSLVCIGNIIFSSIVSEIAVGLYIGSTLGSVGELTEELIQSTSKTLYGSASFMMLIQIGTYAATFLASTFVMKMLGVKRWLEKAVSNPPADGGKRLPVTKSVLIGAVGGIALFGGFSLINTCWNKLLGALGYEISVYSYLFGATDAGSIALMFFGVVLMPVLCEEILFRGVIFRGVRRSGIISSALFSGILFAVYHHTPEQLVNAFIAGIVLTLLYDATGNITANITAHFVNNLLSATVIVLTSFVGGAEALYSNAIFRICYGLFVILGVIAALLLTVFGIKYVIAERKREKALSADGDKKSNARVRGAGNGAFVGSNDAFSEPDPFSTDVPFESASAMRSEGGSGDEDPFSEPRGVNGYNGGMKDDVRRYGERNVGGNLSPEDSQEYGILLATVYALAGIVMSLVLFVYSVFV